MDQYKNYKVTKLPPAGPRKGQSMEDYNNFRDREATKNFPQSTQAHSTRRDSKRANSTGTKRRTA